MQVLPFSLAHGSTRYRAGVKKVAVWVLKDEVLRGVYPERSRRAQNDKKRLGLVHAALCKYSLVSEGDFATSQPVAYED
jgi:hypothetical protein